MSSFCLCVCGLVATHRVTSWLLPSWLLPSCRAVGQSACSSHYFSTERQGCTLCSERPTRQGYTDDPWAPKVGSPPSLRPHTAAAHHTHFLSLCAAAGTFVWLWGERVFIFLSLNVGALRMASVRARSLVMLKRWPLLFPSLGCDRQDAISFVW